MKLLFALCILISINSHAASCCGGGLSLPGMIVSDDKRLFSVQTTATRLSEESLPNGDWSMYPKPRTSQSIQLSLAQLLSDRWQLGGSMIIVNNNQNVSGLDQNNVNLGDSSFFVGYEALPEWEYSPWKPRGYVYIQMVAPTGRSTATALQAGGGVSGRGFWTAGPGFFLSKSFSLLDLVWGGEVHGSLPKVESGVRLVPELGASSLVGVGYLWNRVRLLTSLTLNYEGPVRSDTNGGALQRYVTASLGGAYSLSDDISLSFVYADQTVFGEPVNAPLNRSLAFNFSKRWAR